MTCDDKCNKVMASKSSDDNSSKRACQLCCENGVKRPPFPCVEPAAGDVIAIKYDYRVKFHSQYLFTKFISKVPHLRMTTYNRHICTTVTPLHR